MKIFQHIIFSTIIAIGAITGCTPSGPPVHYVEGTILFDGRPLTEALVDFTPKSGTDGLAAIGRTDKNGTFKLTAMQGGKPGGGTLPGEYIVTITRPEDKPSKTQQIKNPDGSTQKLDLYDSLIPERYNSPETSGLTAVVEKKRNTFTFELEKH